MPVIQNNIIRLLSAVNQISQWMSSNLLCLNPSKTEFIIIGLSAQILFCVYVHFVETPGIPIRT